MSVLQKQNPTSPSYRPVYWVLIDGGQTFPHSSCEKCVQRVIHNMTFITTLRQHVLWFPCDVCRRRPGRARLHWSAVRLLLSDWQVPVCVCRSPAVRSCVPEMLCSSVHTARTPSQSPFPRPVGVKEEKKIYTFQFKISRQHTAGWFWTKIKSRFFFFFLKTRFLI